MSECGVCLTGDMDSCDGSIDGTEIVRLDKPMRCSECLKIVPAGHDIEAASWFVDEDAEEWNEETQDYESATPEEKEPLYTCLICAEIADAFYCDGRMYGGGLWDAMYEVFEFLNQSCFDKLTTPQAKAELQRRWMRWKGLPA